ncbi:MAG: ATP-binding protein [Polyangiaceae bacterium]|jgi:signal transduction histidine kinase|nr:ATP-binding protein [Polyangiaceae bacterium]
MHDTMHEPQLLAAVFFCFLADLLLLVKIEQRLRRARLEGTSLRLRIFGALAIATLTGALLTGLYVIAEEVWVTGVWPVLARIAPKAFLVGSVLLWLSAAGASAVGRIMARSIEEITEAASRIAEGELGAHLPRGHGREARRLSKALASMRRELEGRPYAAAFLRDAWHDLKTPVAALKATVELLEDGAAEDPAAAAQFFQNLRRSTDQLERTIADLVTLSRFETATLAPDQAGSLVSLARDALDALRPIAEARHVTLSLRVEGAPEGTDPAALLRADHAALRRALSNLLDNAINATHRGLVSIVLDDQHPDHVSVDVINEPAEVPREVRERLFERAATARKGSGSGLGLAIARAAIEAHGGRIRFLELGPPRVRVRIDLPR